jgi:hypothetical protein
MMNALRAAEEFSGNRPRRRSTIPAAKQNSSKIRLAIHVPRSGLSAFKLTGLSLQKNGLVHRSIPRFQYLRIRRIARSTAGRSRRITQSSNGHPFRLPSDRIRLVRHPSQLWRPLFRCCGVFYRTRCPVSDRRTATFYVLTGTTRRRNGDEAQTIEPCNLQVAGYLAHIRSVANWGDPAIALSSYGAIAAASAT